MLESAVPPTFNALRLNLPSPTFSPDILLWHIFHITTDSKLQRVFFDSPYSRISAIMHCDSNKGEPFTTLEMLAHLHLFCSHKLQENQHTLPFAIWAGSPLSLPVQCPSSGSSRTPRGEVCSKQWPVPLMTGPGGGLPTDFVAAFAFPWQMMELETPDGSPWLNLAISQNCPGVWVLSSFGHI